MEPGAEIFDGEAKESVDCENGVDGGIAGIYHMGGWVGDTLTSMDGVAERSKARWANGQRYG